MIEVVSEPVLPTENVWVIGADVAVKATLLLAVALLLDRALRARHVLACSTMWNACLLGVLRAVYWLHPLIWTVERLIQSVRERACDAFCIHWLGDRRQYAATLIDLAAATIGCRRPALGLAGARSSKIERRLAHTDRSPASPVCRPRWQIRTLLSGVTAALAIVLGSVELCRVDAAADEPATFDQALGTSEDSGEQTFILSFKGIDPFTPQTAKELLDGFAERHEAGARTHHFRTEVKDGVLIGHLCVDGEAGRDALLSLLAANKRLALIEWNRATPEVLRRHMALGQPSLRGRGSGSRRPGGSLVPYPKDGGPLRFELFDAFGRKVLSDDYLGAPVLIMAGACWCGGCQQDAEQLRLVAEEYRPRGLQVIRSVSGDNELTAVEFQRHYRLPFVQLLDPNREFEMRYNRDGWTFLMLADRDGQVVYRANGADWSYVRTVLDGLVAEGKPPRTVSLEGVDYPQATLARTGEADGPVRRDRFPSVACGADGRVYVALSSNRNGNSDVLLRVFDGNGWSGDRPVAASEADEYDVAVIVDRDGRPWVSWTSNAGSERYNVFVARLSGTGEPAKPTQITRSEDDAMHARMACDERGRIWVTYYKWRKMSGRSRDKEVYLRRFDGDDWSDEIRISPTDVPEYEDHFDPEIVATGDSAAVCWSWDYHRPPGYTRVSQTPTIFVRTVSSALEPGRIYAVSGRNTDTMPAITGLPDGTICCAWESTVYERRAGAGLMGIAFNRRVSTSMVDTEGQERPGPGWNASGARTNVCTPRLAVAPGGVTALVWSEADAQGQWKLQSAFLEAKTKRWTEPKTVVSEANPRFPAAAFDADGRLWIAYSKETEAGRRIDVLGQDFTIDPDEQARELEDPRATPAAQPTLAQRFKEAREALRGKEKNTPLARAILLDLAENHASDFSPVDLCHLYVYLGYIEDLAGNRKAAVGWYEKAVPLEGPQIKWIRQVAEEGLSKPVTWLRHLDATTPTPGGAAGEGRILHRIGQGYVTADQPADPSPPRMGLSAAERLENFEILWEAIDRTYSFFEHKGIDWQEVKARYRPQVEAVETSEGYYRLVSQFVRELGDAHSWLCNWREENRLPRFSPAVSTRRIEEKAVVTRVTEGSEAFAKGLRPGAVITSVDGLSVAEKIERLRPMMKMCSSERNFQEMAYRRLLDGEEGSRVALTFLPRGKETPVEIELARTATGGRQLREPGFPVEKGRFIWSGIHPSGYGYIRILSFSGRMEIADEFDRALENLKDAPALIIDVRDNPGGFGTAQPRIVGRFISAAVRVSTSYQRSGPEHDDFSRRQGVVAPAGDWQYDKPIALLTNAVTGSASDLFACRMIGTGRPITVGTTTHGNLTGVGVFAVLPCGLVVRVSNGYISDASGRIIEGNGNVPQIRAELTIDDVANGTDSVLDRAVEALREARPGETVREARRGK